MNFPPMLFHPINSITAYKGQIIYDTPATEAKAQTPVPYLQWQPAPGVTPPVIRARHQTSAIWCCRRRRRRRARFRPGRPMWSAPADPRTGAGGPAAVPPPASGGGG